MNNFITIQGRNIGTGAAVYIVAEMSANHHQDFDQAVKIIQAAKDAGADAVKLQTYTPDTITIDCHNDYFRIKGDASGTAATSTTSTRRPTRPGSGSPS